MRILQINNFHYFRAGADKVYLDTGKLLEKRGHEVMYFSSKNPLNQPNEFEDFFVEATDLFEGTSIWKKMNKAIRYIYSTEAKKKLTRLIENKKPDIAHIHIYQSRLTSSILPVLKKHNIPIIMTLHEYKMLCPVYSMVDPRGNVCESCQKNRNLFYVVLKRCNRKSLFFSFISYIESQAREWFFKYERYAGRFLGVSNFVVRKHLQYKPHLKDKLFTLYNFIDLDNYKPTSTKGEYYIYVGRLSEEKGVRFLLECWRNYPGIPLLLAGDGPMRSELKGILKSRELSHVIMLGYKNPPELIPIIQNARFLLMPSLTYETFGLTLIEGMACGTPPIAAAIGGMKELVKDGENGLLFKSNNQYDFHRSIILSQNMVRSDYETIVKNGLNFVQENFGSEVHYNLLMKHYGKLAGNRQLERKHSDGHLFCVEK